MTEVLRHVAPDAATLALVLHSTCLHRNSAANSLWLFVLSRWGKTWRMALPASVHGKAHLTLLPACLLLCRRQAMALLNRATATQLPAGK